MQGESSKETSILKVLADLQPPIQKVLSDFIPRKFDNAWLNEMCGHPSYDNDPETLTKVISEPIWEILDRGGKRWRSALVLLIAESLGKDHDTVKDFIVISEIIHNGTLIIDDIEDSSELRRGKPCLHLVYNQDVAINAGNAMYYLPLAILRRKRNIIPEKTLIRCYELCSQELLNLHMGQGMDIWWHGEKGDHTPTTGQYLQMCAFKTGTLARLSAKLSALVCGANDELVDAIGKFAESIGVAFQIQDDILNIVGERFQAESKGLGEDIHEGKRTLMVLHSFQYSSPDQAKRLREILISHPTDPAIITEAINIIKSTKSVEYAKGVARDIAKNAWSKLEPILPKTSASLKLKSFADYLIERDI